MSLLMLFRPRASGGAAPVSFYKDRPALRVKEPVRLGLAMRGGRLYTRRRR